MDNNSEEEIKNYLKDEYSFSHDRFYRRLYDLLKPENLTINYSALTKQLPYTRKSTSETAIKHLKEAYKNGELNFVLGSGISLNFGIPTWEHLLQRLLMTTIEGEPDKAVLLSKFFSKIFNPTPLIAGRYLQESLKDENIKNNFEKKVREVLYETYKNNSESLIVEEIVKFCLAPGKSPNIDSIITYNYDDIIESKLREKNLDLPFESVHGQSINPDNNDLKIYHVHGYLPRNGNINNDNKITLGEFVYHEQYNNTYSWNNIVQINKFRDKTCLFIGTSLNDPNTRRLLDIAKSQKKSSKYHYIFKKKINKTSLKETMKRVISSNSEFNNADIKLEEIIDFLIEMKSRFEEKDSESLGVKTVWVDNYDKDISEILKKIRTL